MTPGAVAAAAGGSIAPSAVGARGGDAAAAAATPAPASAGVAGASAHERNWHLDPTNLMPNGSFRWVGIVP